MCRSLWSTLLCFALFFVLAAGGASSGELVDPGGVIEDIVADPVRPYFYASLETDEVVQVSFITRTVQRVTVSDDPYRLAVARDGSKLFVTLEDTKDVAVYSLPGMAYLTTYDLSATGYLSSIVASDDRLYISDSDRDITIFNTATGFEIIREPTTDFYVYDELALSTDGTTLFGMHTASPNTINVFDVTEDRSVWIGEDCCHGCLGGNGQSIDVSPDGSLLYLASGAPYHVQVLNVPETGQVYHKASILTGPYPNAVVPSADGTLVYVGNAKQQFSIVRTSDWLTYQIVGLQGSLANDGLILASTGNQIGAVIEYEGNDPNRIELINLGSPSPNRGGVMLRPLDSISGLPVGSARLTWTSESTDDWVDSKSGVFGKGPLEAGDYVFDLSATGYEEQEIEVHITNGNWTDLGEIVMVRTGDPPRPDRVCVAPGVPAGKTQIVQFHGRNFLPEALAGSWNANVTIDDFTWLDWATVEATVSVDPTHGSYATYHDMYVENPNGDRDSGPIFILEPQISRVEFQFSGVLVDENAITLDLGVIRTGDLVGEVNVDWSTTTGSATAGQDFAADSGTLTWLDGESASKNITLTIHQDVAVEGDEDFTVDLSNVLGGQLGDIPQVVVTIVDDDAAYLQFSLASASVDEDSGPASIEVTRSGRSDIAVGVDYSTSDGTASQPGDYGVATGSFSWGVGDETSRFIPVSIVNDNDAEGNETIDITLSNLVGDAVFGDPSEMVLTIIDDDGSVFALENAAVDVNERDGTVTISVLRTNSTSGAVSVNYATSDGTAVDGQDYTARTGTLNWSDGDDLPKSFGLPILEDTSLEPDETLTITLSNPTGPSAIGPSGSALVTIADNDQSTLRFQTDQFTVDENAGTAEIVVSRDGSGSGTAAVEYETAAGSATADEDYTPTSGTLEWEDGDLDTKSFTITILDDPLEETPELVLLSLANPLGNVSMGEPVSATLKIYDDETKESQINTTVANLQTFPRTALRSNGEGVVVWESQGQDGWGLGVYGRRIDRYGQFVGGEFQVNQTTDEDQQKASVAVAANGSFVVVWQAAAAGGTQIMARRFDASALPLSDEFPINSSASGGQSAPRIAVDGNDRFLVVWQAGDASGSGVFARVLDAGGVPEGDEFAVNTTTPQSQDTPHVSGSPDGGFVVVWESYTQDDGFSESVIVRRYSSLGVPLSGESIVNTVIAGDQVKPSVAVVGGGGFLVVWEDKTGLDGSGHSIRGQWFTGSGTPAGSEFTINSYTDGNQRNPSAAAEPYGRAAVVWESYGQDGSGSGVFGRMLDDDRTFTSEEIPLNSFSEGAQYRPSVACSASGDFFSVWASIGQDQATEGIFGVVRQLPAGQVVYGDGFESGDTSIWSASTP